MATRSKKRAQARAAKFGGKKLEQKPCANGATEPVQTGTENAASDAEKAGASGTVLTRSDMVDIRRAIRNDWPYDSEKRAELMDELHRIATGEVKVVISSAMTDVEREIEMSGRLKVAAAKTIMAGDSINAKREATDVAREKPSSSITINNDNRSVIITPRKKVRIPDNGRNEGIIVNE